jgi:hypothetical protein
MGETGTLIEDDGSSVPFKVKFPNSETRWFLAESVALAGDLPAPHAASRPRVGQSVRIVGGSFRKGETGTLIEDDGSSMPFKVKFPDSITMWFLAADVALAGHPLAGNPLAVDVAPHFVVGTSVGCTSVGSLGFGFVGCTVAALHADGSVDISIPGVGIYPRVARSAVRLLDGAPAPAFAPMFAPRFGEASMPASVLREQGYPRTYRGDGQEAHGYEGYEQLLDQLLAHTLQRLGG